MIKIIELLDDVIKLNALLNSVMIKMCGLLEYAGWSTCNATENK